MYYLNDNREKCGMAQIVTRNDSHRNSLSLIWWMKGIRTMTAIPALDQSTLSVFKAHKNPRLAFGRELTRIPNSKWQ